MTTLELILLVDRLMQTADAIGPGKSMPFRRYLRRQFRRLGGEIEARLRAGEFTVWVDGHAVAHPGSSIQVTRESRFAVYRQRGSVIEVIPGGAWWN